MRPNLIIAKREIANKHNKIKKQSRQLSPEELQERLKEVSDVILAELKNIEYSEIRSLASKTLCESRGSATKNTKKRSSEEADEEVVDVDEGESLSQEKEHLVKAVKRTKSEL